MTKKVDFFLFLKREMMIALAGLFLIIAWADIATMLVAVSRDIPIEKHLDFFYNETVFCSFIAIGLIAIKKGGELDLSERIKSFCSQWEKPTVVFPAFIIALLSLIGWVAISHMW